MKPKTNRISDDLRLNLLRDLLRRWYLFESVPRRQLKMALSPEEWRRYDAESRQDNFPEPELYLRRQINRYSVLLRKADTLQCRADNHKISLFPHRLRMSVRPVQSRQDRADVAYHRAWEYLEEIAGDYPGIALWFDRPLDLAQNSKTASDCAEGIPRPIWSRSQYTLRHGKPKLSQREIARAALEASYDRLLAAKGSVEIPLETYDSTWIDLEAKSKSEADSFGANDLPLLQLNWPD